MVDTDDRIPGALHLREQQENEERPHHRDVRRRGIQGGRGGDPHAEPRFIRDHTHPQGNHARPARGGPDLRFRARKVRSEEGRGRRHRRHARRPGLLGCHAHGLRDRHRRRCRRRTRDAQGARPAPRQRSHQQGPPQHDKGGSGGRGLRMLLRRGVLSGDISPGRRGHRSKNVQSAPGDNGRHIHTGHQRDRRAHERDRPHRHRQD